MARKAKNCNTHKSGNRRSFDGKPVPAGKVLVPFRIDIFDLKKEDYIDENCTTMRLGDFKYHIGFMTINEALFSTYMKYFWDELNKDMEMRRDGRCIIGKNPDGSDKLCPEPTEEELKINLLAHFDKENPRYAQIIRLKLQGKSVDEICIEINLKPSHGHQEINNTHDTICEYLRLRLPPKCPTLGMAVIRVIDMIYRGLYPF